MGGDRGMTQEEMLLEIERLTRLEEIRKQQVDRLQRKVETLEKELDEVYGQVQET